MTNFENYINELKKITPALNEIQAEYISVSNNLKEKCDNILMNFKGNLIINNCIIGSIGVNHDNENQLGLFGNLVSINDAILIKNWLCHVLTEKQEEFVNIR